ncbi:hypothetical protein, partial [Rhodosalinus sp.]|uniref:hypothetical protein n=1 Tax=Rhodosalinus sp. TaxID=2047741 RepID=UPI00397AF1AE
GLHGLAAELTLQFPDALLELAHLLVAGHIVIASRCGPEGGTTVPTQSLRQAAPNGRNGERSISVPSRRVPLASKCSGCLSEKRNSF